MANRLAKSLKLWSRAEEIIMNGTYLYSRMAGVNIKGVSPIYFVRGQGSRAVDFEGDEYVDYSMALGPAILGYARKEVNKAVIDQLKQGAIFSLPHPKEVEAAEILTSIIPCAEMVRLFKTGSEATEAAVRIARAATGREMILKGHYHGWHEWCIVDTVKGGGVPQALKDYAVTFEWGELEKCEQAFKKHRGKIAAIITEPVGYPEHPDFLKQLQTLAHKNGALLIYDEVVTGFRFGLGGAQEYFKVIPDVAAFGKAMANGLPLSAVCGRKEIFLRAKDKIFVSTTFGGDVLSLSAFIKTVEILKKERGPQKIWRLGKRLKEEANKIFAKYGISDWVSVIGYPPVMGFKFKDTEIKCLFMQEIVKRKIFSVWNILISTAHTDKDIDITLKAFDEAASVCKKAISENRVKKYLLGELPITVI